METGAMYYSIPLNPKPYSIPARAKHLKPRGTEEINVVGVLETIHELEESWVVLIVI